MERKILHIDMDAFFAAVEQLDNPAYRGKPVIVGGPQGRGVVSTCSYEARKFGVHSAMPLKEALRLCPQGIFLPVRGARYAEISRQVMKVLADYTPLIEPLSLDEAFLDLTGSEALFGPIQGIGRTIVKRIEAEIGLSASVGIAPNKFLAKLGSDLHKPKGFVIITSENASAILENLPVNKLWGVGARTETELLQLGIRTIGMLRLVNPEKLHQKFGDSGIQLHRLAQGIDERPVVTGDEAKSIGHELTFQVDTDDRDFLAGVMLCLAEQVARRLRRHQLKCRVITIKIRDKYFKTVTKRATLPMVTDFEETIYEQALNLANQLEWGRDQVRLLGISVSGFDCVPAQLSLFGDEQVVENNELTALHQVIDRLKDKYGDSVLTKGTILKVKEKFKTEI